MSFKKFPKPLLVETAKGNLKREFDVEQVEEWLGDTAKKLEELIEQDSKRMMNIFNYGPLPNSEIDFLKGRIEARKELLEALGE